jgi:hypothetical protein
LNLLLVCLPLGLCLNPFLLIMYIGSIRTTRQIAVFIKCASVIFIVYLISEYLLSKINENKKIKYVVWLPLLTAISSIVFVGFEYLKSAWTFFLLGFVYSPIAWILYIVIVLFRIFVFNNKLPNKNEKG